MRQRKLIIAACIFLALFVFAYNIISAQQAGKGISVHPSNFDITAQPNNTATGKVTVDNLTDKAINITVDLRNFTAKGEEGSVDLTTEDIAYSLAKWIKVNPTNAEIKAHGSHDFTFTIEAPANAEPGGHFGSIVFATVPSKDLKGSGATLSQEVASLILFKIPGDTKEAATVESFATDKSFYEFGPVTITTRVKNEGGVHISPAGSVVIKGWFGQSFTAPLEMRNVLPNAVRKIPATLENKLLFGQYTATLIATYGTKGQQLNASTQFSAFPVRYGFVVLAILIIIFLFRKRIIRSLKILMTGK